MKTRFLLATAIATVALSAPAFAAEEPLHGDRATDAKASPVPAPPAKRAFSTGVAKGRDLLDTAISASSLEDSEISELGTASVVGIVGNIPGIRAESSGADGYSAISVRGLPLAADGSKFIQIQEDGLPVLEFGDIHFAGVDQFVRADLGLQQIEAIRGGSASTFASNSPGGVINFISNTGEQAGGALQVSAGIDHDLNRIDFRYGAPLGNGWRFHVGGFYHDGEGPRATGYTAFKGGQVKANLTRQFDGGYIRFYAKYLDDRQPNYGLYPVRISGTNDAPVLGNVPGTDMQSDTLTSQFTATFPKLDENNGVSLLDVRQGNHGVAKAVGMEAQVDVAGWTVSDKLRFADISGAYNETLPAVIAPAATVGGMLGGAGATLRYATGPKTGQAIASPATLNGNGLLAYSLYIDATLNDLDNVTNDLRASRVWNVGQGKLTTTAGVYYSRQNIDMYWSFNTAVQDVVGGGQAALVDVRTAGGTAVTQGGVHAWGLGIIGPQSGYHYRYAAAVRILAPYASLNYQTGPLSVGGSVRFDDGSVNGQVLGADLGGGRVGVGAVDFNHDGVISATEQQVAVLPLGQPGAVDYGYHYTSWSVGANYRLADSASAFARYSRGGRAGADRLWAVPKLNPASGKLNDPTLAYAPVKQAEVGFKYRKADLSLFVTGFWAKTGDRNYQIGADASGTVVVSQINREYEAKGIELESELRRGPFALALGATWADAKISHDATDATIEGNKPRHQPSLFFTARPQFESGPVTLGATVNGTTSSYAQDVNLLKQPGYVVVSPFVRLRPAHGIELSLNAWNVFDTQGVVQIAAAAIPPSGLVNAQMITGRTLTAALRFDF